MRHQNDDSAEKADPSLEELVESSRRLRVEADAVRQRTWKLLEALDGTRVVVDAMAAEFRERST